jgi:methylase of polypeptide subunit release factors
VLGDPVSVVDAAAAVPLDDSAPLLERAADEVRARYDLAPYGDESHDWYVVADRTDAGGRPFRSDHVVGIGAASTTLAQLTVRSPAERALDIGTGSGVQALHLATHSRHVVATDVVPRALTLAATTFALSGVDVTAVESDLVDGVRDQRFDRVVCNPPFVVGPATRFAYRDGGGQAGDAGDAMSRRAVEAAAAVLAPDGIAHLLVNWVHVTGEDWRDRAASWVAGLGCDALLLERDVQDPADYVDTWLADAGEGGDAAMAAQWLGWLRDRQVEGIGLGWVALRRTDGAARIAVEELRQPVEQPLGPHLAGWIDRVDWLRAADDDTLLATAFTAAPGVRLDRVAVPGPQGWVAAGQLLGLDGGFRWSLPCDEPTAALVGACDGSRSVAAVAAVLELTTGVPAAELRPAVCATVRGLVDRGLLLPPSERT